MKETCKDLFIGNKIQVWFDTANSLYAMYFIDRGTTFYFHFQSMFIDLKECLEEWDKHKEYTGDHVSIIIYKNEKSNVDDSDDVELVFRYIGSITIFEKEVEEIKTELDEIIRIVESYDIKIGEKWK